MTGSSPAPSREGANSEAEKLLNQIASWKKANKPEGYVAEIVLNSLQYAEEKSGDNVANDFVKYFGNDVNKASDKMKELTQKYKDAVARVRPSSGDKATIVAQYFHGTLSRTLEKSNLECDYERLLKGSTAILSKIESTRSR